MQWHAQETAQACSQLSVDPLQGLGQAEVDSRLAADGPNRLRQEQGRSVWRLLWDQFTSVMALLLEGAALMSLFMGSYHDALSILAIVCLFALLGFVQEFRAERSMAALRHLAEPLATVRRGGVVSRVAAPGLVVGDVVLLEAGQLVPADCRLLEVYGLRCQESVLTGESETVVKQTTVITEQLPSMADCFNMVWMGTTVVAGRGEALVVATGMSTQLGNIAGMLQGKSHPPSPLQVRLDHLGKLLALTATAVAILVFALGVWRGEALQEMLMTAISLAVAAIPEGLPAVVTITMAIGARRMLRRRALIRKLPAVETLGSVSVICTDKTGTLTQNRMTVTALLPETGDVGSAAWGSVTPEGRQQLFRLALVLCNDATLGQNCHGNVDLGDPTEVALLAEAAGHGLERSAMEVLFPRMAEVPFDSVHKRMLTLHQVTGGGVLFLQGIGLSATPGDRLVIVKGAFEALAPLVSGEAGRMTGVAERVEQLSARGQRVLAAAVRLQDGAGQLVSDPLTEQFQLLGLVTMVDPPRPEVARAVATCRQAGIRPVMITGDHPLTALAIAERVGILSPAGCLTGRDLDQLADSAFNTRVGEVSVFARVSPEHKLRIVQALQKRGEVVAMTGDGVNDGPALQSADIGVAMGLAGTDVAREAADMVLLDDDFATIVAAVEEGRIIFDNLRRFIEFSVAGNLGKILVVVLLPFLGLPNPLLPLQLLWLNLMTDGLLGLGMGMERPEPDLMNRPPIPPTARIFDRRMLRYVVLTGIVIGASTMLLARHYWSSQGGGEWQTVLLSSLAFAQIGQALALRSRRSSLLAIGPFSNPLLICMIVAVVLLQLMVVYLPVMQPVFKTRTLPLPELIAVFIPAAVVFALLELEKKVASVGRPASNHPAEG